MKTYGLLGKSLKHSFSPKYFTQKFIDLNIKDAQYLAFNLASIDEFPLLLEKHDNICGLNVTIPYKEQIIPYLDELTETAKTIGAVNTIVFRDGKLIGDNTDAYGFEKSLSSFIPNFKDISQAIILGSGGASKAIQYVLNQNEIKFHVVSRKKNISYLNYRTFSKKIIKKTTLIINTTPLGMYPNINKYPKIKYQYLDNNHYLYDLIYNPEKTRFLLKGETAQTQIKSAGDMLIFQAEKSWELWNV